MHKITLLSLLFLCNDAIWVAKRSRAQLKRIGGLAVSTKRLVEDAPVYLSPKKMSCPGASYRGPLQVADLKLARDALKHPMQLLEDSLASCMRNKNVRELISKKCFRQLTEGPSLKQEMSASFKRAFDAGVVAPSFEQVCDLINMEWTVFWPTLYNRLLLSGDEDVNGRSHTLERGLSLAVDDLSFALKWHWIAIRSSDQCSPSFRDIASEFRNNLTRNIDLVERKTKCRVLRLLSHREPPKLLQLKEISILMENFHSFLLAEGAPKSNFYDSIYRQALQGVIKHSQNEVLAATDNVFHNVVHRKSLISCWHLYGGGEGMIASDIMNCHKVQRNKEYWDRVRRALIQAVPFLQILNYEMLCNYLTNPDVFAMFDFRHCFSRFVEDDRNTCDRETLFMALKIYVNLAQYLVKGYGTQGEHTIEEDQTCRDELATSVSFFLSSHIDPQIRDIEMPLVIGTRGGF